MKRLLVLLLLVSLTALAPTSSHAQELLTNGNLNVIDEDGNPNPALYWSLPLGWTIDTDPGSYYPADPVIRYPAWPAGFAERATPDDPDPADPMNPRNGVLFNSTEGDYPGWPDVIFVDADLHQTMPGSPGLMYRMSGWAYFEGGFAGGVDTIATGTGTTREGLPSLTDVFFALEFLDAGDNVLAGSISEIPGIDNGYELRAHGQVNNPDMTEETRNWMEHVLIATAPAGTVSVRVRASMVDGEFNIDMPHQAMWLDDFSLTVVPEPATWLLGLLGLALVGAVRRTR